MSVKRSAALTAAAAVVLSGPLSLSLQAAQSVRLNTTLPSAGSSVRVNFTGNALTAPVLDTGLTLTAPSLTPILNTAAPAVVPTVGIAAAVELTQTLANAPAIQILSAKDEKSSAQHGSTLGKVFDQSSGGSVLPSDVLGNSGIVASGLNKAVSPSVLPGGKGIEKVASSVDNAAGSGAIWDAIKRNWAVLMGWLRIGTNKVEANNAEALAANYIAELEATMPKLRQAVADIGKTVYLLDAQLKEETKKAAELDENINEAIRLKMDAEAENMISTKEAIDASLTATQTQLEAAQKSLAGAKKNADDFYHQKQQKIAEVKALMAQDKAAKMDKKLAEMKATYKVGDLNDQFEKLKGIVNENVAEAKGTADAAQTDAEKAQDKIKESVANRKVKEELEKRRAAIEAEQKAKNGGSDQK